MFIKKECTIKIIFWIKKDLLSFKRPEVAIGGDKSVNYIHLRKTVLFQSTVK